MVLAFDDIFKQPSLAIFLENPSIETRRLSTFDGYDITAAKKLCDAINKYNSMVA